ncbi:MAG: nicotinate (nicotinamide) nucleotide adenylyltransferase [Clostridia bacterium]|nr:nicotinate (nicotinamide) nucleotide adenylyltransferase [Clostridia bacterium]
MNKKIVFFGGTFDPPHLEHVNMVKSVAKEISPQKIIIMPTFIPPHKKVFLPASPKQRLQFCKEAFSGINDVEISDWEIKQQGKSYSYLTMQKIKADYQDCQILFLMGTDMISTFDKWKNPLEILKVATPLLCVRRGEGISKESSIQEFKRKFNVEIQTLEYEGNELSSTDVKIEKMLLSNVSNMVGDGVNQLIDEFLVYNYGKLSQFVVENLTPKRIEHTKGVIRLALKYAKVYKVSLHQTAIASLLHDVAKYLKIEDYPDFKPPKNVPYQVMHQYLGAYVAENILGVKDRQILNAIKYHTSAKPKMSLLAKIVFTADMLEEGRTYDRAKEIRELSFKDFDKAFLLSMQRSLDYVNERGCEVYPLTEKAYNYYNQRVKGD